MGVFDDFKVLSWNVRGFASCRSHMHMQDLLSRLKPDLVLLYETHTAFSGAKRFWDRAAFSLVGIEEAQGHAGGIWVLKNNNTTFNVFVRESMHQAVTFTISRGRQTWACTAVYASPTNSLRCQM